jgi:hypothetical protein
MQHLSAGAVSGWLLASNECRCSKEGMMAHNDRTSHHIGDTYPAHLVDLLVHPDRAVPQLTAEQSTLSLLGFPAALGIFVAYTVAKGLALGDRFGHWPVLAGVVLIGAVAGFIALWFTGALPQWNALDGEGGEVENARSFTVFSDAAWPFLPLLLIIVPLEWYFWGTTVFSGSRSAEPVAGVWLIRGLIVIAHALWIVMAVRGMAAVRHESERQAVGELVRWGAELTVIAAVLLLTLMVSAIPW